LRRAKVARYAKKTAASKSSYVASGDTCALVCQNTAWNFNRIGSNHAASCAVRDLVN